MKYFQKGAYTKDKLKKRYKELAKQYHPDKGGSDQDFQEMNQEYLLILDKFKKTSSSSSNYVQDKKMDIDSILNSMGLRNSMHRKMAKQVIKAGGQALVDYLQKNLKQI